MKYLILGNMQLVSYFPLNIFVVNNFNIKLVFQIKV